FLAVEHLRTQPRTAALRHHPFPSPGSGVEGFHTKGSDMTHGSSRPALRLGALLLLSLASLTPMARAQSVTGYSGNAFVIRTDDSNQAPVFGATGALPSSGGSLSASLGSFTDAYKFTHLSGGAAATSGGGGNADSSAQVTGFQFGTTTGDIAPLGGAPAN